VLDRRRRIAIWVLNISPSAAAAITLRTRFHCLHGLGRIVSRHGNGLLRRRFTPAAISFSARRMHDSSAYTSMMQSARRPSLPAGPPELAYIFAKAAPAANRVSFPGVASRLRAVAQRARAFFRGAGPAITSSSASDRGQQRQLAGAEGASVRSRSALEYRECSVLKYGHRDADLWTMYGKSTPDTVRESIAERLSRFAHQPDFRSTNEITGIITRWI